MNQITSKLGMIRLCLISFILLCGVFKSENALSQQGWDKDNARVYYNSLEKSSITISLVFYVYFWQKDEHSFLKSCDFEYTEDGVQYTQLMSVRTEKQHQMDRTWIRLSNKKLREHIYYLNSTGTNDFRIWPSKNKDFKVEVRVEDWLNVKRSNRSELSLKWNNHKSCKNIKNIRLKGEWRNSAGLKGESIYEVYMPDYAKPNSKSLQNTPSEFTLEVSNNVNVTGESDAITVTGVEPGENIKVYTTSGVEIKSFVATDDVVNIKLPANQIYIVNVGQKRHKVAF